jgi:hypothetical protein
MIATVNIALVIYSGETGGSGDGTDMVISSLARSMLACSQRWPVARNPFGRTWSRKRLISCRKRSARDY